MPTDGGAAERRQAVRGGGAQPHPAEPDNLPCPRCDSTNTKFCYYNNYNLSQPRYFCKSCRRYWTRGGTLRNVPVGGGSRKNSKRSRSSPSSSATSAPAIPPPPLPAAEIAVIPPSSFNGDVMIKNEIPSELNLNEGSFTSLLTSNAAAFQGGGFLGYGFEEMGLGLEYGDYGYGPPVAEGQVEESDGGGSGSYAWQLGGSDSGGGGGANAVHGGAYMDWV